MPCQPTPPPHEDLFLQVTSEMAVLLLEGQTIASSRRRRSPANMEKAFPFVNRMTISLHVSVRGVGVGSPPYAVGEGQGQQMPNTGHGAGKTKKEIAI